MNGLTAYILSKKYTEDSLMGAGALKGEKGENGLSIKALSITQDDTGKIVDATATLSDNSTIKVDIITSDTPDEERLEGDGAEYYTLAPTPLSFRSDAPLNELQDVQINGVTVDPSNYTLEEGSTIVTFPIDYLKTLETGDYEVTIASESKSVKGGFTVAAPELNERGFYYNQPYTAYVAMLGTKVSFFVREDGTFDSITGSGGIETGTYEIVENTIVSNNSLGTLHSAISTNGMEIYCTEIATSFVLGDESITADEDYIYMYKEDLGGYEVKAIDETKAEYGAIKTGINGIDTVKLTRTYNNCRNLISAPLIPNTVISISEYAFFSCSDLTSVTIPDSVTTIGNYAFSGCSDLTNITIPDSVTSIGSGAFTNCDNLTSMTIPDSVTSIGDDAFNACDSLTSVTIPDSVTSIGDGAFNACDSLASIIVDANNPNYCSVDGNLFNKEKTTLIKYAIGKSDTHYTIPDSVTTIVNYAFSGCSDLTSVSLGNSVTSIGDFAFFSCSDLTSVTIPDSVTTIGNYAFSGCSDLTNITIPDSVTSIGDGAFNACDSLASIIYEGFIENWNKIQLANGWNKNVLATHVQCSDGTVEL